MNRHISKIPFFKNSKRSVKPESCCQTWSPTNPCYLNDIRSTTLDQENFKLGSKLTKLFQCKKSTHIVYF